MPIQPVRFPQTILVLVLLFFGQLWVSSLVLQRSRVIRVCDENTRIVQGVIIERCLFEHQGCMRGEMAQSILSLRGQSHPPLYAFMEALVLRMAASVSHDTLVDTVILLTNGIFLFILIFSLYGIARVYYSEAVSLVSVVVASALPLVFGHTRVLMLDFPLMAMVTLSMYFLARSDFFRIQPFGILFGVCAALAQITKESAVLFLAAPAVYCISVSIRRERTGDSIKNILFCVASFLVVVGIVYARPENQHVWTVYYGKIFGISHNTDPWYYLRVFAELTGPAMLAVFVVALVTRVFRPQGRYLFLWVWFLAPLILFSLSPNKTLRFMLPIMPALAILAVGAVENTPFLRKRFSPAMALFVFIALGQYICLNTQKTVLIRSRQLEFGIMGVTIDPYFEDATELRRIFEKESAKIVGEKTIGNILFLFNPDCLGAPLEIEIFIDDLPFLVRNYLIRDSVDIREITGMDTDEEVSAASYVVDITVAPFELPHNQELRSRLRASFDRLKDAFDVLSEQTIHTGPKVVVYKRRGL